MKTANHHCLAPPAPTAFALALSALFAVAGCEPEADPPWPDAAAPTTGEPYQVPETAETSDVMADASGPDDSDAAGSPGEEGGSDDAGEGGGDTPEAPFVANDCTGPVAFVYDPDDTELPPAFPDDFFAYEELTTYTGMRLDYTVDRVPWLGILPFPFDSVIPAMDSLDGWGTTAGIQLPFDGPVSAPPAGDEASLEDDGLWLIELTADGDYLRRPYEASLIDDGQTLSLWPMLPLRPATRHAVVVTTDYLDDAGGCIGTPPKMAELLNSQLPSEEFASLSGRHAEVLTATGLEPDEVVGIVAFTTQSIVESSVGIAEDIQGRKFGFSGPADCTLDNGIPRCDRRFGVWSYADGKKIPDGTDFPVKSYELPVRFWIPVGEPGPRPAVIFGHGLGSGRSQGKELAGPMGEENAVTIAIDAPGHGDHAIPGSDEDIETVISFFGFNMDTLVFDPLALRDVWRQATFDKLQLIELLVQNPDLDGDGVEDIDTSRLAYLGASLGGIMGAEFLALSDKIDSAIVMIAGARLSFMVRESEEIGAFIPLLLPGLNDSEVERVFALLQTVIERGDGANYAPYVLRDRLPVGGEVPPDLLMTMSLGDAIVPNETTRILARSFGLPQLSPVLVDIGLVGTSQAPLTANLDDAETTAGIFQFDRMTENPGDVPEPATHNDLPLSVESLTQTKHWYRTWWDNGVSEVIDPYLELGTPRLSQ